MSTQAAECAAKFATRRDERIRQETNAAIDRYAREIADATFRLKRSLHTEGDQRRADRTWAALQIERARLDVCRALGEA